MTILEAQQDVRRVYRNGVPGSVISALPWLASAACATWVNERTAILVLVFGGMLIFPTLLAVLKLLGGPAGLPKGHPMDQLGMQVALVAPLTMPVAGAAALYRLDWFYPAFMVLIGAHYLPFAFLYGMKEFAVVAYAMVAGGVMLGLYGPREFAFGGWINGAALVALAVWLAATRGAGSRPAAN